MKKILFFTVLLFSIFSFSATAVTNYPDDESVELQRGALHKDPRLAESATTLSVMTLDAVSVQSLSTDVNVDVNINEDYLSLYVDGYKGIVNVEIDGLFGYTTSYFCNKSTYEELPLSSLIEGETYTVRVIVENEVVYTTTFEN